MTTSTITKPVHISNETRKLQQVEVEAISVEHAKLMTTAYLQIAPSQIHSVDMLRKPREATTCVTDDYPVKGARKWVTQYCVYSYGQRVPIGKSKFFYTDLELQAEGYLTKTDAVKAAKDLSVKLQLPMTVKIVKVLEDDDNTVSDIQVKTGNGRYKVKFYV